MTTTTNPQTADGPAIPLENCIANIDSVFEPDPHAAGRVYTPNYRTLCSIFPEPLVHHMLHAGGRKEYRMPAVPKGSYALLRVYDTWTLTRDLSRAAGAESIDEWEDGTGPHPNQTGIFRMGFPFIAVPVREIFEHGYRGTLATDMTQFSKDSCDPDLWAEWQSKTHHKGTLAQMQRLISKNIVKFADPPCPQCGTGKHSLTAHIVDRKNNTPAASLEYPYYLDKTGELNIILDAGWKDTKSTPKDDWGSRPAVCKVFCHFGCSTERHNSRVIREFANWQQSGDSGYAFWTTNLSVGITSLLWLQHLLSYDQPNAFKPWKDSLKYAYDKTNADLKNGKFKFLLSDGSKKK